MKYDKIIDKETMTRALLKIDEVQNPDSEDIQLIIDVIMNCLSSEREAGLESIEILETYHYDSEEKYGAEYWGNLYITLLHYKDADIVVPILKVNGKPYVSCPTQWHEWRWKENRWEAGPMSAIRHAEEWLWGKMSKEEILDKLSYRWMRDYITEYGDGRYDISELKQQINRRS